MGGLSFVPLLQSRTASPILLASGALNGSPRELEASLLRSPLHQILVPRVPYASHPSLFSPKVRELSWRKGKPRARESILAQD